MKIDLSQPVGNAVALMSCVRQWGRQLDWEPQKTEGVIDSMMGAPNYATVLDIIDREFPDLVEWVNDPRKE